MDISRILVIPDYVKQSFDGQEISLDALTEAIEDGKDNDLKEVIAKVSSNDMADVVALTSYVLINLKNNGDDICNNSIASIENIDGLLSGRKIEPTIYMNNINTNDYDFKSIMKDKRTPLEIVSNLSDDLIDVSVHNSFLIAVVSDKFLKLLKLRKSTALLELFTNFLNLESKVLGGDRNKSKTLNYFLQTLYNR